MSLGFAEIGPVIVKTTHHRGFTPEEITDMIMDRIMFISDNAPMEIREQAKAFRDNIRAIIVDAMKQAVRSDRTTLTAKLNDVGQHEAANIIGKL